MLLDTFQRPLRNLRLSVTDRCNLRCSYCMPEAEYAWLPRENILHFEEIERLVDVFVSLSVHQDENFGYAPIEAMACGVPAVVTDWGGYRDSVVHGETDELQDAEVALHKRGHIAECDPPSRCAYPMIVLTRR